ncbi:aminopeptidase N [Faunimonas sp. B44]|uniref:aminopeptidase N n=1 Tax=Faunimonas sp. B44 TaxID=3461493 RepID=UPI0040449F29
MAAEETPIVRLEDYRPTDYSIETVELDFRLAPEATEVRSRLRLAPRPGTPAGTPLALDGDGLVLKSLAMDGAALPAEAFAATPDRLTIHAPPARPFDLEVVTRLDPSANTTLMGLYISNGIYATQCEAEGFRRITYFLDRPDVLAVYTTRIEARADEAPVLLSNGNLVEAGAIPGTDRHFAVWHDPFPKPSYLFALVGGNLAAVHDRFRTMSGRDVRLAIYCEPGKEERCRYAMDALKRSMRWDEERFGREYDLDVFNIVAVSDFNMGAMENKGLNVFNDKYVLVDPETGTDQDYAGVETVIAHEYFHNWTGNRITCRDWFQLCLKEGLTVFRDQEFTSDMRSRPVKRIADVVALRQHQFPEDAGPLAHPPRPTTYREINNFYTATVYEKGAEICRMLQTVLGRHGFRAGMDLYFERHDGDAATIEDFIACFADATGTDLSQFSLWYHQAGTPTLHAEHAYDPDRQRLTLRLQQDLPETPDRRPKHAMHVPVAFGLVGPDGQDLSFRRAEGARVDDGIIHLTTGSAEITFDGVTARPVPSLLRGFSAPVRLRSDVSRDDRLFLIGHDPDPFSRWEAAQSIGLEFLRAGTAAVRAGRRPEFDGRFAEELGRLAANDELDPAFRALALMLPSEGDVAQAIGSDVDPDAIHEARLALQSAIGETIAEIVSEAAARNAPAPAYSPDAGQAGRRALAHAAWSLGIAGGLIGSEDMLSRYRDAGNLTDRLAALRLAAHHRLGCADEALSAFYEQYRGNALVLDKWLMVQATIPAHDTVDRVRNLMRHPAFSMKTPNRVYALLRSFATANPVGFNRADGAGFRLIADVIAEIDPHNPSVAARLATAFRSFAMLEPARRAAAQAALSDLSARPNLSRDVGDILLRTLEG